MTPNGAAPKPPNRLKKFLVIHGLALAAILFFLFVYRCPTYTFLHIPCPACGITRAYVAVLSLNWSAAFQYHPLFFLVLPLLIYIPHKRLFKNRLNDKVEAALFFLIVILFLGVYSFRLWNGSFN